MVGESSLMRFTIATTVTMHEFEFPLVNILEGTFDHSIERPRNRFYE